MTCLMRVVLPILALFLTLAYGNLVELPLDQRQRLENGEQEFQKIRSRADHSECWEKAVSGLRNGCKQLTDVEQSRLAIAFANCHFEKSGLKKYPCSESDTIEECTKDMVKSVLAFNTYTEFYTHTSDICFYLQSEAWQQKTEDTINKLSSSSSMVADNLEASLVNQQQVLEGQKNSLSNQGEILENEAYLKSALKTSAESAKEAFMDMKKATAQQKAVLMDTFDSLFKGVDRITKLQSMLLGEFMTLHSLGFYLVSIFACYIITSAPRTAAARLWLFGVLSVHIVIERLIVKWNITDKESQQSGTTAEVIHGQLWIFRKIFVFEGFLILVYFGTKYCDYGRVNYNMLKDIQIELKKLRYKGMDIGKYLTDGINRSFSIEETLTSYANYSVGNYPDLHHQHPLLNLDETCLSEEDLYTDDNSDSNAEDSSGSESEDPTFNLDTSQMVVADNKQLATVEKEFTIFSGTSGSKTAKCWYSGPCMQLPMLIIPDDHKWVFLPSESCPILEHSCETLPTSCADQRPPVYAYSLRPRRVASYLNEGSDKHCLPDPKTLSDLVFNLTRSTLQHSQTRRLPRSGKTAKTATYSCDEED